MGIMISHVIRLKPHDDFYKCLQSYIIQKQITAGYVASAIGSLSELKVRFATQDKYTTQKADYEIIAISGTLSPDGSHLHGLFSDKNGNSIGGHIKEGCVIRTTAEIILVELSSWSFNRKPDSETGYLELEAEKK